MDLNQFRNDFPLLTNDPAMVYLDSSATSLKPQCVIDTVSEYYSRYSANIKRGIYKISEEATAQYEAARAAVAVLIGAQSREIIFTKNCTESLNLIAYTLGAELVGENDEIVTTIMEHHSNFIPWQRLASVNRGIFKVIDCTDDGKLALDDESIHTIISKRTKIVTLTHISNVLGTINPIKELIKKIKRRNPKTIVIVDGAQAVGHIPVNVVDLGCDFYAFSGHKMMGPTGIGVLWGRAELLESMEPFLMGGEMVKSVSIESTEFADLPEKFEAGTPPIAEAIGLHAAVDYIQKIGIDRIRNHEINLTEYAITSLKKAFGSIITIYGPERADKRGGIIAFNIADIHPHDVSSILSEQSVCIRAGHHCAMPLHTRLGIAASCRISLHLYNNTTDIDSLIKELIKVQTIFTR